MDPIKSKDEHLLIFFFLNFGSIFILEDYNPTLNN